MVRPCPVYPDSEVRFSTSDFRFTPGSRRIAQGVAISAIAASAVPGATLAAAGATAATSQPRRSDGSVCTHFPREVVETALAHVVGDAAEQAYRRSDALEKRRKLMEAWASYCEPKANSNVLQLRKG